MSGTHGVFQHRSGYFYTVLEEDFCEMYKAPGVNEVCRAYITSILETLTNKQYEATGCDEDIWVYMSIPEMARRMRNACSERLIHKELQGMIADGYLTKRRAVGKATMEYRLNIGQIRARLGMLPEKQSCNSAISLSDNLANVQEPSCNSARLTLQNCKNDLANLQARISNRLPLENIENTEVTVSATQSDDRDATASVSSSPSAPEPSLSDSQSDVRDAHPSRQSESPAHIPPPPVSPVTQALTIPVAHHRTYLAWSEARAAFKRDLSAAWKADKADAAHPLQSEYTTFQRFSNEYLTRWYAANPQPPQAVPTQPAKPVLPVLDEALQRRVDNTYACFDECARETTGEPDAAYARTPESTSAIVKALERKTPKLSRKRLRNCYRRLYDQPRGRNGWYCREHMEIWRVLEEYGNNPALGAPLERTPTSRESAPPPPPSREQLREESKRYALAAAGGGH